MSRHEISRWIDQQSVIDIQLSRWALFHWIVPTTAQHQLTTTTIETSCTWDGHTHLLPLGCIGSDVKTWNIKMNWPTMSHWCMGHSRWALLHWIVPTTAQHQLTTTTIEISCTWDGHTHLLPLGSIESDVKTWNIKMNWPTMSHWCMGHSRWALLHWIVPTTAQHQLTTTTIETSCTWDGHTHLLPLGCIGSDVKTWNIKMNWPTISYWHTTFQVGAIPLNSTHNSTAPTDYYYNRNLMHLGWPHTHLLPLDALNQMSRHEISRWIDQQSVIAIRLSRWALFHWIVPMTAQHQLTTTTIEPHAPGMATHTFTSSRMHWIRCQDMKYQDELTNNQLLTYNFPGGRYSTE